MKPELQSSLAWPFPRLLRGVWAMCSHAYTFLQNLQGKMIKWQLIKTVVSSHSDFSFKTFILCRWSWKGPGHFGIRLRESWVGDTFIWPLVRCLVKLLQDVPEKERLPENAKSPVLTHTAPCAGPETLPWLDVSLCTRLQWDMSHEGTSFEIYEQLTCGKFYQASDM